MTKPGLAPRRAALELAIEVAGEGRLLSDSRWRALCDLSAQDRARARNLILTLLRWMDRADRVLEPYLRKRPPLPAMMALRLGVVELRVLGTAPHAVVDAQTELMSSDRKTAGLSGLVNAVLRKIATEGSNVWDDLPMPRLPKWLRGMLLATYGKATVAGIEAAHAVGASLDLTSKCGDGAGLAARLEAVELPTGSVRLEEPGQLTALPGYAEGEWWVQDAAAALPAKALAAKPGLDVLDICAAPGGKTMQLAAAGYAVTALDKEPKRMARLEENLSRTRLRAETVTADAMTWRTDRTFGSVLLDAPCSATGTIRRHPDLPHAKDGASFPELFRLQAGLLDRAVSLLAPEGRLVYSVCSLLPEECEIQIEEALARHSCLSLDPKALEIPGIDSDWTTPGGVRTRPDYWPEFGGMDGFFIAALRKDK